MAEAVRDFKRRLLGRDDIILHTADITRNRNGFEAMKDAAFRKRFYAELNDLMRGLEYQVVACAIRKDAHIARYGVAERRDPTLDHELELAWLNLKIQGTRYLQARQIESRILALNLRAKAENIAGLQLADLVVTPIGRHVLGKPSKEDFEIVRSKLRRSRSGVVEGYGLVVLPK